ncbi:MAG: hypothetical protein JOZ69_05015 [Myxococcales bacterium]|nr:hypothetical protein [Myxococcales bacterium]
MNTVAHHVGRLIEIRVTTGFRTPAEVDQFFSAVYMEGCKAVPENEPIGVARLVTVADWRRCPVLPGEVADHVRARMAGNNRAVLRAAALVGVDSPSARMQFSRVVRETGLENRKVFHDPRALLHWLAEVMAPDETRRLEVFLTE